MPTSQRTGTGLIFPLRREHGDFAHASGATLVRSNIRSILGVKAATPDGKFAGEYPWALRFGAWVDRLRHANLDAASRDDLIRVAVTDAVAMWEPRATVDTPSVGVVKTDGGRATAIKVRFSLADDDDASMAEAEVTIG